LDARSAENAATSATALSFAKEGRMSEQTPQPGQQQDLPGSQSELEPEPPVTPPGYAGSGKLAGKAAIITGGDSGIGRSVAVLFAREGADVAIVYRSEHDDAEETQRLVEAEGRRCLTYAGDVGDEAFCRRVVGEAVAALGRLDVLVNNAAEQQTKTSLDEISAEQLERTFRSNIFSHFFMTKAALPHLGEGASIIGTTSVTAYQGNPALVDYASTKGAIVAFTYSLSQQLKEKKIRVNAVAPGPVWTPLIPATMPADKVESFGAQTIEERPAWPSEIAPAYVFLASPEATMYSGQVLHPNGGQVVNG
jgi:NAD(P)-dependent dehydrogenase (short-subunit alcohol dehydrogenase family)